jgi:predicted secreted protein
MHQLCHTSGQNWRSRIRRLKQKAPIEIDA